MEDITGYKPGGRTALAIFEQDVLPKLALPFELGVPAAKTT
ncbi:hypothetical protein ACRS2S_30405 [Achromobacter xylosoxidans]